MPRQDVSEERKAQILDAAAVVFSQQGFANARMDDIVRESELSKGALYWYFKSKDEIITALMHRFFSQDLDEFTAILESDEPARDILLAYVTQLSSAYDSMESLLPLMYDYYSSATRDADKQAFFRQYFQDYQAVIRQVIQKGIDVGDFKVIDVDNFVVTLTAIIEGLLLLNTIEIDMQPLNQQITQSVSLLIESIQAI